MVLTRRSGKPGYASPQKTVGEVTDEEAIKINQLYETKQVPKTHLLYVDRSTLNGAGLGTFAKKNIHAGKIVCDYGGRKISRDDCLTTTSDYVFGNGDQRTFPARKPILLRYTTSVPFLDPIQPVWPGDTQKISLPNMARLTVSWVGDASLGTNRPLQMTLTVRDLVNAQQTVSLSRTIFPLTD